jgi:hypothetical protein
MSASSAFADGFDFRNARWGMNRFEVMASEESGPTRVGPDEILYCVSLFRRPAYLLYRLDDEHLVGARYVLPVKGSDTLEKVASLVALRYGGPCRDSLSEGDARVWNPPGRTVRLFFPKKGQAVIDIVSEGAVAASSKKRARLRRNTSEALLGSL